MSALVLTALLVWHALTSPNFRRNRDIVRSPDLQCADIHLRADLPCVCSMRS